MKPASLPARSGNILIPSAGNKVPFIKAVISARDKLNLESKVIAGDVSENVVSRYFAESFWKMPGLPGTDFSEILDGCLERDIKVVIPSRDQELTFWAKHKNSFAHNGVNVVVSDVDIVSTCLDKLAFSKFGLKHKMPVIPSYLQASDCDSAKLVVKEQFGSGSRKILVNCDLLEATEFARTLDRPIFQPFIEGTEISVDIYRSMKGTFTVASTRTRDLVVEGESKVTTVFIDKNTQSQFESLATQLGLAGPAVMQAKVTPNGLFVIECNPRFGGASTAAISAGLPILEFSLGEAFGLSIDKSASDIILLPLVQIRTEMDVVEFDSNI